MAVKSVDAMAFLLENIILCLCLASAAGLALDCGSDAAAQGASLTCVCESDQNIEWFKGTSQISACGASGICSPEPPEYNFAHSVSGSNSLYELEIHSYSFDSCGTYACQNVGSTVKVSKELGIIAELEPTATLEVVEPSSGSYGTITVTTPCISPSKPISGARWSTNNGDRISSVSQTVACTSSCGYKYQTKFEYTAPSNAEAARTFTLQVTITAGDGTTVYADLGNEYSLVIGCDCECDCQIRICEKILFAIFYPVTGVAVVVALLIWCKYGNRLKIFTKRTLMISMPIVSVLLVIASTICAWLDQCECTCGCEDNVHTTKILLTVFAWIFFAIDAAISVVYFGNTGCKSKSDPSVKLPMN